MNDHSIVCVSRILIYNQESKVSMFFNFADKKNFFCRYLFTAAAILLILWKKVIPYVCHTYTFQRLKCTEINSL